MTSDDRRPGGNFLCIARDFKGVATIRALHELGHNVYLVTDEKNRRDPWPHDALADIRYVPPRGKRPHDKQTLVEGTAWAMREHGVDRIIALDDFDVEDAALLREEFRIPGMGQTTARHFRDKLAMRMRAREAGIPVPAFSDLFSRDHLERFLGTHGGPYVIKPRGEASAAGITKAADAEAARAAFAGLGERNYEYLIECFAPGAVYHVDSLSQNGQVGFVRASEYVAPPLSIVQGGGLFQTRTLAPDSEVHRELSSLNTRVVETFGLQISASHTEFIRDDTGRFLFLETSSRVGGAYIANMLAHATGVDLWRQWGLLEAANYSGKSFAMPLDRGGYAGIVLRAVGDEQPDLSGISDEAIAEVIRKPYHVGFIVTAPHYPALVEVQARVAEWVASYGRGY